MDTKQMLTFITLAELGNYIKAADRLNYAPSTLAKHIRSLEAELGVKLVEHRDNKILLTSQGQRFYGYATQMLETYWQATEEFTDPGHLSGCIRVAGGEPIVGFSLSKHFLDFSMQYPNVSVNVQMICCARVPAWIRNREVDIGYIYEMELQHSNVYETIPLYNEPICLVTTADHPLANSSRVLYRDLTDQRFAFTYEDCCFTMAFRDKLRQQGILPESELFLGSVAAVLHSVSSDNRIALIPYSAVPRLPASANLVCLSWQDEPVRPWVQILYDRSRHLTPAEKEMISQAQHYAQSLVEQDAECQLYA